MNAYNAVIVIFSSDMFVQIFNRFKIVYKTMDANTLFTESTKLCRLITTYGDYSIYRKFRKSAKNKDLAVEQGYIFSYTLIARDMSKSIDYPFFIRELVRLMIECPDEHEQAIYSNFLLTTTCEFTNSLVIVDELYKVLGNEYEQYQELLDFPLRFVTNLVPVSTYISAIDKYFNNPLSINLYNRYLQEIRNRY